MHFIFSKMKIKFYLFVAICLFTISCSKNYLFDRDQYKISKELKLISSTDQAVRFYEIGLFKRFNVRTAAYIWDSLAIAGNKNMGSFDLSKLPSREKQIARMSEENRKKYKVDSERGQILMDYIDKENAQKVYEITKKYGYPSYDERKWKNDSLRVGIAFVLTHINHFGEISDKVRNLMIDEYLKGRVDEGTMQQYLWDVDGREGTPFGKDIVVTEWIKNYKEKQKK
jgi:hypothetical protein